MSGGAASGFRFKHAMRVVSGIPRAGPRSGVGVMEPWKQTHQRGTKMPAYRIPLRRQ